MGKARSWLCFPSAAASLRALTWEGAAEAMPARMSRRCLRKVSPSPYKVILKGKYFPSNFVDWSGSVFRLAGMLARMNNVWLLLSVAVSLGSIPSLCSSWGCGTVVWGSGELAGSQAGTHASFSVGFAALCVCGRDFPRAPKHQGIPRSA